MNTDTGQPKINLCKYIDFDGIVDEIFSRVEVRDRHMVKDFNDYSMWRLYVTHDFDLHLVEKTLLHAMRERSKIKKAAQEKMWDKFCAAMDSSDAMGIYGN